MTKPERCYLVCSTQRSGSTLLCELLMASGVAGRPYEYFEAVHDTGRPPHPGDYLHGLPRTGAGVRDDSTPPRAPEYSSLEGVDDYRDHLARTLETGTTDNGVFGAKLMFNQIPEVRALTAGFPEFTDCDDAGLLARVLGDPPELKYIWVSREDKVRQAVSLWRAMQTRSWRYDESQHVNFEPQYRFTGIDHLVNRLQADDEGWGKFFAEHRIEPLKVCYEDDLERDPSAAVNAALDFIGVSAPADWTAGPPLKRQADTLSDTWVAAYQEDSATRGERPSPSGSAD
jgi:trehalose 2-sulfotransferase